MWNSTIRRLSAVSLAVAGMFSLPLIAADPPVTPKVSTFAPADELLKIVETSLADFDTALATEKSYVESKENLVRQAHVLTIVGQALALHDGDHRLKAASPALLVASQKLAKAKDYAGAKAALEEVKSAAGGNATDAPAPAWNKKAASLGQIMKQAPILQTKLNRDVRRLDRTSDSAAVSATLLAVIAQAAVGDTHEVKNPADVDKWFKWSGDFRDAAVEVHAAAKAKDPNAAQAALKKLSQSCDTCHATFHTE